jgi:DUF1680 family protein
VNRLRQYYDYNHKLKVKNKLFAPLYGVDLGDGLFKQVFDNNRTFLKRLDMDRMRYWFDRKAGRPTQVEPYRGHFEDNLKGQTAYEFLMGAGNALRFAEDGELRKRLDAIVDYIADGADGNGFCMPVDEADFAVREYPHYVRIWLTYGLIAAWRGGNIKAKEILRAWQDWFNQCVDLPVIKYLELAFQGVVASPTVYLTDIGKPEDMDVTREHYEETWRLAQFMRMEKEAVYIRNQPGKEPHAHGTELEAMEGYLDLYRYTGANYYLKAVLGAWELYHRDWQHLGGGIVMCEFEKTAGPGCNILDNKKYYNELCCTSFWLYLNQRLHFMFPDEEKYVLEMEQSIYNIAVANQQGDESIRYFAYLDKQKQEGGLNHCCCGVGTRIFGSLPEYLFTVSEDMVSLDIFARAALRWQRGGDTVNIEVDTDFPFDNAVKLTVGIGPLVNPKLHGFNLRIRVPSYAQGPMSVLVNGEAAAVGEPGGYVTLTRIWKDGDTVTFAPKLGLTRSKYTGVGEVEGYDRYGYMYGPVLMALCGEPNHECGILLPEDCRDLSALKPGEGLEVAIPGGNYRLRPYFAVQSETFTCFPLVAESSTAAACPGN